MYDALTLLLASAIILTIGAGTILILAFIFSFINRIGNPYDKW